MSLVRYYIPFDHDSIVRGFFERKISEGTFILLDTVSEECCYVARGLIVKELSFIKQKENITKTDDADLTRTYYNKVKEEFLYRSQKRNLIGHEFEKHVNTYVESADSKIILKALKCKALGNPITVVTEETRSNNDHKLFKKIPSICDIIEVGCLHLPQMLISHDKEILISMAKP